MQATQVTAFPSVDLHVLSVRFYVFVEQLLYIPALRGGLVSAQVTAFPTVDLHVLNVAFIPVPAVSHVRPQIAKTDSVSAVAYHGMT